MGGLWHCYTHITHPLAVEIQGPVTMPLLGPGPAPAVATLGPGTAVPAAVAAPAFGAQAPGVQNMPGRGDPHIMQNLNHLGISINILVLKQMVLGLPHLQNPQYCTYLMQCNAL